MNDHNKLYHIRSHPNIIKIQYQYYREMLILLIILTGFRPLKLSAEYTPLAMGKDKFLGCATNSSLTRYLERYFNQVTPGNDGKWQSVENVRNQYSWTNLDKIYNYALSRNFPFKHHCLIWGQQQPYWISELDSANQRAEIEEWIRDVGARYPKMTQVDVVNEPIMAPPDGGSSRANYKNALGGNGATGWDWVITAFELARQYCDSSTELLLNEYNVLHDNARTTSYINIINLLKERNLIDGIGIQGHYFEFRSDISATSGVYIWDISTIKSNLNRLVATGLPVYITEFDIDEPIDANQLAQYQIYFPIFWSNPGVKGITLWGYIQGDVWNSHPNTYLLLSTGTERPALEWLRTYILSPKQPELISPIAPATGVPLNPVLIWHSSATATAYHVQVARNSTFPKATTVVDTTVADTLLQVGLVANTKYYWRVSGINEYGTGDSSKSTSFTTGNEVAIGKESEEILTEFNLFQNFPNPFNPTTSIEYSLAVEGFVQLQIFDILGREVKTLVNQKMPAGKHNLKFNADGLNSGIYFYKLKSGDFEQMKKMLLIK